MKFKKIISVIKYSVLVLLPSWLFLLSLRPVVSRDALKLHMAFPDLWKDEGFLFFRRFNAKIELGMMNVDYLYMLLLKFFSWEQLPKILHASFLIMTGFAIYFFIKKRFSEFYALWSFVLILTIPIHIRLASEVYVDLGLLFFSTVCVIYYIKAVEKDFNYRHLLISAIACGLAAGTKYNGFVFAFIMCLAVIIDLSKKIKKTELLKWSFIYVILILIMISPWLCRNFVGTGNPMYPLFNNFFNSNILEPEKLFFDPSEAKEIYLRSQQGESFFYILLLPLRFFFTGKDHDFLRFDGVLNPFILFLLPFAFFRMKDNIGKGIKIRLLIIFIFILLFVSFYQSQRVRYTLPFMAPLIILITAGYFNLLEMIRNKKIKYALALIISLPVFAFNLNYGYNYINNTDMGGYLTGQINKEQYLDKHLTMYKMYKYINENTPDNSVIYDVLCGNRYYYVNRKYVCSPSNLNWWVFNITYKGGKTENYLDFFSDLPNTDSLKADYLLIKPEVYYNSFLEVYYNQDDPSNGDNFQKLNGFVEFINKQRPVFKDEDTVLYELNYESNH